MATVNRFKIATIALNAAQSAGFVWNNTPRDVVTIVDCVVTASSVGTPARIELVTTYNEDHWKPNNTRERKFGMVFKNTGSTPCSYDIYMSQIH
jgi:hypothetical protein